MKYFMSLLVLISSLGFSQSPEELDRLVKQRDVRRGQGEEIVSVYVELFQKGPSAEGFIRLGAEYLKANKPIQAAEMYQRALDLDAQSSEAKAGMATADRTLKEKEQLMAKFEADEKATKESRFVCSRAAVLYHLGYMGDAIDLLVESQKHFRDPTELRGLEATFKAGIAVESLLIRTILRDFFHAIESKDKNKALLNLAEYQFFSLGTGDPSKMIDKIGETFKADLDIQKVKAVLTSKSA